MDKEEPPRKERPWRLMAKWALQGLHMRISPVGGQDISEVTEQQGFIIGLDQGLRISHDLFSACETLL